MTQEQLDEVRNIRNVTNETFDRTLKTLFAMMKAFNDLPAFDRSESRRMRWLASARNSLEDACVALQHVLDVDTEYDTGEPKSEYL